MSAGLVSLWEFLCRSEWGPNHLPVFGVIEPGAPSCYMGCDRAPHCSESSVHGARAGLHVEVTCRNRSCHGMEFNQPRRKARPSNGSGSRV